MTGHKTLTSALLGVSMTAKLNTDCITYYSYRCKLLLDYGLQHAVQVQNCSLSIHHKRVTGLYRVSEIRTQMGDFIQFHLASQNLSK